MRIFFSATSIRASYGGPAYSVKRLAECMVSMGHDVAVWAADGSTPDDEWCVQVMRGDLHDALSQFGRPDIVHDNGIWLSHNHRVAVTALNERIPRVVSVRGMLEPWARRHKRLKKAVAWRLYQNRDLQRASVLHATSTNEARNLESLFPGNRHAMIPNGVDVPAQSEYAPRSEKRVALFVGRLYPVKGLPMLIEAWNGVRPEGWELRIAGPDEQGHRGELEQMVRRLQLRDDVTFMGPVHGTAKSSLFNSADLFVAPSHTESFGMAIGEAMAHGLPVLTTTSTPWPEIESENLGWIANPSPGDIASALRNATATDREILRQTGARAREFVRERYSWHRAASEFEKLYSSVAGA